MTTPLHHATAAASRLLPLWARHGHGRVQDLELAAWVLARQGLPLPVRATTRRLTLHLQLAACLARRDEPGAATVLDQGLREPDGALLLMHACHLAGPFMPDTLVAVAERHRGSAFNGQMLAATREPERLWALVVDEVPLGHRIITLGELLLRAHDSGRALPAFEAIWAQLAADPWDHAYDSRYRDIWLRIVSRQTLAKAAERLHEWASGFGCTEIYDGAAAVLARLVRQDPAGAASQVAALPNAADRAMWLQMLTWWFDLPAAAEALLPPLLAVPLADDAAGALVHALARARAPHWLERALQQSHDLSAFALARVGAAAASQLADAGLMADADRLREQLLPRLRADEGAADLFDLLAAPDQPAWVPWGTGPGLP